MNSFNIKDVCSMLFLVQVIIFMQIKMNVIVSFHVRYLHFSKLWWMVDPHLFTYQIHIGPNITGKKIVIICIFEKAIQSREVDNLLRKSMLNVKVFPSPINRGHSEKREEKKRTDPHNIELHSRS